MSGPRTLSALVEGQREAYRDTLDFVEHQRRLYTPTGGATWEDGMVSAFKTIETHLREKLGIENSEMEDSPDYFTIQRCRERYERRVGPPSRRGKVAAIKMLRNIAGLTLKQAKEQIEAWADEYCWDKPE